MEPGIKMSLACCLTAAAALVALPLAADHHEGKEHAHQAQQPAAAPDEEAMMQAWMAAATPGEAHQRLAESTGTYKATIKMWMGPGEPQVTEGTSKREAILGGRVVVDQFESTMMGQPFVGHGMMGYDNVRKKYWSVWTDNMSTAVMVGWGTWDEEKGALVMESEMMDPMTGQPVAVRTVSRSPQPGTEVFEMWEDHGGEMVRTMEITYVKQ